MAGHRRAHHAQADEGDRTHFPSLAGHEGTSSTASVNRERTFEIGHNDDVIDHLVLATPDVASTSGQIRSQWGVAVVAGGSHTGRGTRNELTGLGGSTYLEIVGPDAGQPTPAGPRPFGVDELTQPAFVAWCARPTRPLGEVLDRLASHGIDLGPASEMWRMRPDGVQLNWQLTFPLLGEPHHGTIPFLIDWLDSPHPADSLPHDAQLMTLHIVHPQADLIRVVLAEVGQSDVIEINEGLACLCAEVRTPHGDLMF